MDVHVMERVLETSPQVASAVARAAWVARCARRMAECAGDVELEQAWAVAQVLVDDVGLSKVPPEVIGERIVRGR
jgi:hypothetical protein